MGEEQAAIHKHDPASPRLAADAPGVAAFRGKGGLVRVIGHRGAMGYAPENTMPSFAEAIKLGVDFIECDVHLTRDGVPVVIHDPTVDRTTNGSGAVADATATEIGRLDAGLWFGAAHAGARVPKLSEVLDLAHGRCGILIEIKAGGLAGVEEAVMRQVQERDARSWAAVIATDPQSLKRLRLMAPWMHLALVCGPECAVPVVVARDAGADGVVIHASLVTPDVVAGAAAAGLWVAPWTVNDARVAEDMARMGVDGIIGNYPDRLQPYRLRGLLPWGRGDVRFGL